MDGIELSVTQEPAKKLSYGDCVGQLAAGKHLTIETSPHGDDLLDYEVPAGKQAHARVSVSITETDL